MLDKLLTRVMPLLFAAALVAVLLPATSAPLLRFLAAWYSGQSR